MAKQSGLHQIKGKVGEFSYYKSAGVNGGLIRSINQGLSERVKNGEEYANARLNNQEFAAAANVAGLLGKMVIPKFRPMILPFSQSRMAKGLFAMARQNTGNWGERVVDTSNTQQICELLTAQSKRDFNEFLYFSVNRPSESQINIEVGWNGAQATLMNSLGITDITVSLSLYHLATGKWNSAARAMQKGYFVRPTLRYPYDVYEVVAGQNDSAGENIPVIRFAPTSDYNGHQIIILVAMPLRTINGVPHVLQEYCSFVALPLPEFVAP